MPLLCPVFERPAEAENQVESYVVVVVRVCAAVVINECLGRGAVTLRNNGRRIWERERVTLETQNMKRFSWPPCCLHSESLRCQKAAISLDFSEVLYYTMNNSSVDKSNKPRRPHSTIFRATRSSTHPAIARNFFNGRIVKKVCRIHSKQKKVTSTVNNSSVECPVKVTSTRTAEFRLTPRREVGQDPPIHRKKLEKEEERRPPQRVIFRSPLQSRAYVYNILYCIAIFYHTVFLYLITYSINLFLIATSCLSKRNQTHQGPGLHYPIN